MEGLKSEYAPRILDAEYGIGGTGRFLIHDSMYDEAFVTGITLSCTSSSRARDNRVI